LDRMTFVRHAVENRDHLTLAVLLMGPAYLSGLTERDQAGLRLQAGGALTPDTLSQLEERDKVRPNQATLGDKCLS
jgi:hypothetical protein